MGAGGSSRRMNSTRIQILVTLMALSFFGYYIFSYFHENQQLALQLNAVNLKLKRYSKLFMSMEKKYKTSHSNEQLYAQSNRDLQMNLAKQEKQMAEINVQLDQEKTKLADAFFFYTEMKGMLGVIGKKDSYERKVEAPVVKSLKDKVTEWKSLAEDHHILKQNYTLLSNKHTEVEKDIHSLHMSHRKLQRDHSNTSKGYADLKKLYNDVLVKYKNVSNAYAQQLSVSTQLEKQVENYKLAQTHVRPKPEDNGNGNDVAVTTVIPLTANEFKTIPQTLRVSSIQKHESKRDLKETEKKIKDNSNGTSLRQSVKLSRTNQSLQGTTITALNSSLAQKKEASTSIKVSTPAALTKNRSTVAPSGQSRHNESDASIKEYLENETQLVEGEFDKEEKYEPPHIKDRLDANGLSMKGTADE